MSHLVASARPSHLRLIAALDDYEPAAAGTAPAPPTAVATVPTGADVIRIDRLRGGDGADAVSWHCWICWVDEPTDLAA